MIHKYVLLIDVYLFIFLPYSKDILKCIQFRHIKLEPFFEWIVFSFYF